MSARFPLVIGLCTLLLTGCYTTAGTSSQGPSAAAPREAYKDPGTATLFGLLITGGGQLYAGETGKGLTILIVGTAAPLVGFLASDVATTCTGFGGCYDETNLTSFYIGAAIGVGAWLYGVATAGEDARRANREAGFSAGLQPAAVPAGGGSIRPGVQLTMQW